jgi:hypothetical protein
MVCQHPVNRRDFLKGVSFLGMAMRFTINPRYNPGAKFELNVTELEYQTGGAVHDRPYFVDSRKGARS